MKNKIIALLPFLAMLIFIPIYYILDNVILVDIFGCGCVPTTQSNMFNIPYNANDLRLTVFSVLTIMLSIWGVHISKNFNNIAKITYCITVVLVNVLLTVLVVETFMWA